MGVDGREANESGMDNRRQKREKDSSLRASLIHPALS